MSKRDTLITAALQVLEQEGAAQFSTRAVCTIAAVTAPTLYHYFDNANGLLSAALEEAFRQFLGGKEAAIQSSDPLEALRQGWDDYVRFAADRPRLYAAMMARILQCAHIPAAEQGYLMLIERIEAIAAVGRLSMSVEAAAQVAWASANAAALLYVTAALEVTTRLRVPGPEVIDSLRERAIAAICTPDAKVENR